MRSSGKISIRLPVWGSIAALNNGLEAVKCNVLFASHDHQLVQTVANRVFDFTSDGKLIDRKMTYDEYLESQKAD